MIGDMPVLAERRIRIERDGVEGQRESVLQIGHPQWSKGGDEAVCAIAIKGLYDDLPPVRGRDFFDVLVQAVRTLRRHCRTLPPGIRLFYGDGVTPYEGEPFDAETVAEVQSRLDTLARLAGPALVERKILMQEDDSDERREVVLQIGHPFWSAEDSMAVCPIVIKGQDEVLSPGSGRDLFEALSNAVRSINEYFARPQCGRFFFWPDGEPYGGDFPDIPPPRYERDPREKAGNWQVLAERSLLMERDGEPRRPIAIRIGHPYRWKEGEEDAGCPMEIKGLCGDMGAARGDSSYFALIMALEVFEKAFRQTDPTSRFFWPDGTPYAGEPLDRDPDTAGAA